MSYQTTTRCKGETIDFLRKFLKWTLTVMVHLGTWVVFYSLESQAIISLFDWLEENAIGSTQINPSVGKGRDEDECAAKRKTHQRPIEDVKLTGGKADGVREQGGREVFPSSSDLILGLGWYKNRFVRALGLSSFLIT